MKIVVFGATGTVGRHIVDRALLQGHEVTAFARNTASVALSHPRLTIVEGDVLLAQDVLSAVAGQEAAIVAIGWFVARLSPAQQFLQVPVPTSEQDETSEPVSTENAI